MSDAQRPVLSFAAGYHLRAKPLCDGRVKMENFELKAIAFEEDGKGHEEFLAGRYDTGEFSLANYLALKSRGEPLMAIPVFPNRKFRHSYIFVREDSPLKEPAELKGKTFVVSRLGGIEETAARLALDRLGVGARNVSFLQAGPDPVRIAALESGSAQATMLAPPGLFAATSRGLNLLADLGALKIKYPTSVVAARRAFVVQERTVAKRFLMALVEGLHLYRQNKNLAIQVLQKYTKIANADILSQSYNYFVKNTPALPLSEAATIQAALPTDKPTNRKIEDFYDNSVLEELEREGFLKTLGK